MNDNKSSVMGKLFGNSFYIEVFGIFMPGVVAIGATVLTTAFLFWYATGVSLFDMLNVAGSSTAYSIGWVFFIALSYSVGAVIYRRGPKYPDYMAAYNQFKESKHSDGRGRLAFEFYEKSADGERFTKRLTLYLKKKFLKHKWIKRKSFFNPDFPYPFLRRYLYRRGFAHLVDYVNWCEGVKLYEIQETLKKSIHEAESQKYDKKLWFRVKNFFRKKKCLRRMMFYDGKKLNSHHGMDKKTRSKQSINIIKHRLNAIGISSICDDIKRNESHIRLLSSLWYVMRYMKLISIVSVCILLCVAGWQAIKHIKSIPSTGFNQQACTNICVAKEVFTYSQNMTDFEKGRNLVRDIEISCYAIVLLSSILWISIRIRRDVEKSINYVRIRELIAILEGAWIYDNKLREPNQPAMFDDIVAEGQQFDEYICSNCPYRVSCCP